MSDLLLAEEVRIQYQQISEKYPNDIYLKDAFDGIFEALQKRNGYKLSVNLWLFNLRFKMLSK